MNKLFLGILLVGGVAGATTQVDLARKIIEKDVYYKASLSLEKIVDLFDDATVTELKKVITDDVMLAEIELLAAKRANQ